MSQYKFKLKYCTYMKYVYTLSGSEHCFIAALI